MKRLAGDQDVMFSAKDDKEQRRLLLNYAIDNIEQALSVYSGQQVGVKIMFDAVQS